MNRFRKSCTCLLRVLAFCFVAVGISAAGALPQGWTQYQVSGDTLYGSHYGLVSSYGTLGVEPVGDPFAYSATSPDFNNVQQGGCDDPDCTSWWGSENWTGTITGGTFAIGIEDSFGNVHMLTGSLTKGAVWGNSYGDWDGYPHPPSVNLNVEATFSGTWDSGRVSHGFFNLSGDAFGTSGTVTFTPEPESLLLLGSGVLGLAGILRRKLRF